MTFESEFRAIVAETNRRSAEIRAEILVLQRKLEDLETEKNRRIAALRAAENNVQDVSNSNPRGESLRFRSALDMLR